MEGILDLQTADQLLKAGRDLLLLGSTAKEFIPEWVKEKFKGPIKQAEAEKNIENTLTMVREKVGSRQRDPEASVTVADQLLEACAEEDRKILQDLWATLLARVATGEGSSITRDIIDTVKSFEPLDALVLKGAVLLGRPQFDVKSLYQYVVTNIPNGSQYTVGDVAASCRRLFNRECFDYHQKGLPPTQRFEPSNILELAYQGENVLRAVGDLR